MGNFAAWQAKIIHFIRRNRSWVKAAFCILGVLAILAFGYLNAQEAHDESFIKVDGKSDSHEKTQNTASAENVTADDDGASTDTQSDMLCVYICGQVTSPGVYYVAAGARVCDVVEQAQGFLEDAAPESLNLAREVHDGEQIIVSSKNEASNAGGEGQSLDSGSLININTANASQLEQIPGIGSALAQRIITYRNTQGPFESIDDLKNVSGIGSKKFESMREYLCV